MAQLQKNLEALSTRSPTQMIRDGLSPEDMINLLLVSSDAVPSYARNNHAGGAP